MKLKIYIVEDSPIIAASLKQLVTCMGHSVAGISASYEEAILELTHTDIDMVITDIMLSGKKNGIDLAAYIKENLNIPVIYQSSITDKHLVYEAMNTQPLAYLVKPVSKIQLTNALLSLAAA
ncbi:response regulator [Mucilaginibacter sp. dw_454]|uniref:response regulator n=1 Tax=Mucilaginibacter sp. dw_454 TaxID=2720079 RepID=UPI001BD1DFD0|nr:response regulator [Mucilaginibacter sp. dw_454]